MSELSAIRRPFLAASVLLFAASQVPAAERPQTRPPAPVGQDIVAKDGDRVILEEDARVQVVRRRAATVRTIFNQAQRLLIVLIDYPPAPGAMPDGTVDSMVSYFDIDGTWPLGARWEGATTVEEYSTAAGPFARGVGLTTPAGVVQLFPDSSPFEPLPRDPSAIAALSFRGSNGGGGNLSFDQAERQQLAQAAGLAGTRGGSAGAAGGFVTGSTTSRGPAQGGMNVVGGVRGAPQKIRDVEPIYPDEARRANVRGVVIVEITVGVDGSVMDARIVRSIPLLDAAALDAVRLWQYEPVRDHGIPVPVIMTVSVPF
jgi:TonB family protein